MDTYLRRFFIALIPPDEVQKVANEIKDDFEEVYDSKAAKKSPPHITLQPPFEWPLDQVEKLNQALFNFDSSYSEIPIILDGFSAFKPRVIYINVLRTPELMKLQKDLTFYLENTLNIVDPKSQNRTFKPHLTVAFRDLKKTAFAEAWQVYKDQPLHFSFMISELTLLIHNGKRWNICKTFNLNQKNQL